MSKPFTERKGKDILGYSATGSFGTIASSEYHNLLDLLKDRNDFTGEITIKSFTCDEGEEARQYCIKEGHIKEND